MRKILLAVVVLAVVLVGWGLLRNNGNVVENTPTPTVSPVPTFLGPPETVTPFPVVSKNLVTYTDSGYTPSTITVKKGEIVTWKNESNIPMWTASAVHPTHKAYLGTDIVLCAALRSIAMFDSCAGVAMGQSWSFKFDNIGTWKYHNHSNPSHTGTIIVE